MSASGTSAKSLVSQLASDPSEIPEGAYSPNLANKFPNRPMNFGFEYRGIPFVVRAEAREQGTDLELRASLGTLPYTAEDPERRSTALKILDAASSALGGRIRLNREQRVILVERYRLSGPLTPAVLLTRTVELVLQAKPYLMLLSLVVPPPIQRGEGVPEVN